MGVQFAGNILVQSNGGPLPIANGGTGQTSANAAFNALVPSQTGNSGKFLTTNGTNTSWATVSGGVSSFNSRTGDITLLDTDVTGALTYTPLNKAGDSMSGDLTMTGGATVTGLPSPSNGTDATNKNYVDNAINGLSWKIPVLATTTVNITLSAPQTIDGVSVQAGNRVLVKNQSTTSQNGIYIVAAGLWTRATDFDSITPIDEINGAAVFVQQGTTQADTGWVETAEVTIVGTDPITFVQFSAAGSYTAGTGITLIGNQFSLTTPVTAILGGTGQTSYTTGDILYASSSTALSKLAASTSGFVLTSNGAGVAPTWQTASGGTPSILANDVTLGTIINTAVSITGVAGNTTSASASMTIIPGGNSSTGNNLTLSAGSSTNTSAGGIVTVNGGDSGASAAGGGAAIFRGGDSSNFGISNAASTVRGGDATGNSSVAGALTVRGGNSSHVNATTGGALTLAGGTAGSGSGGAVIIQTGGTSLTTRITVTTTGLIQTAGRIDMTTYSENSSSITSSATQNIDCSLATIFPITLSTSITTLTFSNIPATGRVFSMTLFITQAGGGSKTITWPASVKWSGGTTPTLTTTNGKVDVITLVTFDGGTIWYGFVGGLNF